MIIQSILLGMKIVIQRVKQASVSVEGNSVGSIEHGYLLLVGIHSDDTIDDVNYCAKKVNGMRIFEDEAGKMNLDIHQVGGSILSISQFTLYGDSRKGNRPSFIEAARPEKANELYLAFNEVLRNYGNTVETGVFQADMKVSLINDGPVTIIVNSRDR